MRLKNLRDEVTTTMSNNSNQKSTISSSISYAEDSVENMARDITQRFRQLVKQRETLQNAVNIL